MNFVLMGTPEHSLGVKFKYLAEENYHRVKVPDFGSGAVLKTFV